MIIFFQLPWRWAQTTYATAYPEHGNKLRFYALPLDVAIQRLKKRMWPFAASNQKRKKYPRAV
jgi:hypothetical protein